ncbi:oxidoreductase [Chitinophaga nivalis]|uniref:Oxidoreductase n=1 Tax=Chitinophaga nivalis TaxID=2991709 RepID=A0ABT3IRU8_9BACT|nr:oxidoreductase [Chitinophaga nivalis]MCW3463605.1 oxidoreductase [Chitinophaga nivalis]MCW3486705.1 oxidoreductase [Chitinophaga nivalis]
MMNKTAIVIGATGLTGTHLVAALLQDPAFGKVKVLVRQPWAHQREKLETILVDFNDETQLAAALHGDALFCCIGTTIRKAGSQETFRQVDFDIPVRCATIAHRQGVRQFLLISSIGADNRSRNFYLRTKGETEAAILQTGFVSTCIFRPSFLIGQREEFRLGEWIAKYLIQLFYFLLQGKWKKYRGIKAATVAHAMVMAAKQDDTGTHIFESDAIQQTGA